MTVNTETFYPDTCQCVIALAWDDAANPVTYSGVSIVKDAPHNLLIDTAASCFVRKLDEGWRIWSSILYFLR